MPRAFTSGRNVHAIDNYIEIVCLRCGASWEPGSEAELAQRSKRRVAALYEHHRRRIEADPGAARILGEAYAKAVLDEPEAEAASPPSPRSISDVRLDRRVAMIVLGVVALCIAVILYVAVSAKTGL